MQRLWRIAPEYRMMFLWTSGAAGHFYYKIIILFQVTVICRGSGYPEYDGFCVKNDGFCVKNHGFCVKNDGFCDKNHGFRRAFRGTRLMLNQAEVRIPSMFSSFPPVNSLKLSIFCSIFLSLWNVPYSLLSHTDCIRLFRRSAEWRWWAWGRSQWLRRSWKS